MGKGSKKGGKGFQWGGFKGKGKGKQLEVKRSINIVRKVPEWQGSSSTEKAAIGKTRRQPRPDGGVTRVRNDDHVENPQDAVEKAKMAARRAKYGPVERTLPSLAFKGIVLVSLHLLFIFVPGAYFRCVLHLSLRSWIQSTVMATNPHRTVVNSQLRITPNGMHCAQKYQPRG
eukprot:GEMP01044499.1.p1 GENE.GEMP01044499.1~~GEMP01044499.1.p1  ORF type:complete len:173 (+),score=20.99 GEMP01044499.1:39-557(+)